MCFQIKSTIHDALPFIKWITEKTESKSLEKNEIKKRSQQEIDDSLSLSSKEHSETIDMKQNEEKIQENNIKKQKNN